MREEQFSERLNRLFPEEKGKMTVGGSHVRDITIQVTESCNMACTYCYQHDKSAKRLDEATGKAFIDLLLAADERTSQYIKSDETAGCILNFIGGEPLLEIDLIDTLTDYFIGKCIELNHPWATRFRIGICTNGLLYFDERVQNYIRKNRKHLSLSVSVDGDKALHDACRIDIDGRGTYDRAIAAVKHYREHWGGYVGSKVTLAPGNVGHTAQAIRHFANFGYKHINANCVYEEGWTIDHAKILYEQLKEVSDSIRGKDTYVSILDWACGTPWGKNHERPWCGGTGLMLCMDVRGDLYPCLRYTPSSVGPNVTPYRIGTVKDGIMATEEQCARVKCMACTTRSSQCATAPECRECPIATGCGDCAAYSYEKFGTPNSRTTYHCEMHKARVLAVIYHKNMGYREEGSSERFPMNVPKEWAVPIIGEAEYQKLCELSEVT